MQNFIEQLVYLSEEQVHMGVEHGQRTWCRVLDEQLPEKKSSTNASPLHFASTTSCSCMSRRFLAPAGCATTGHHLCRRAAGRRRFTRLAGEVARPSIPNAIPSPGRPPRPRRLSVRYHPSNDLISSIPAAEENVGEPKIPWTKNNSEPKMSANRK